MRFCRGKCVNIGAILNVTKCLRMTPLVDKHSFRLNSQSADYQAIQSLADLSAVNWSADSWILGDGSNTVFTENYAGKIIHNCLPGHRIQEYPAYFTVTIAGGENWHYWVERLIAQGIYGFENLALIPGSIGAAPVQNIGAYGVEVSQFVSQVRGVDLATGQGFAFSNADCCFGYRDSVFKRHENRSLFITEVDFQLPKRWKPVLDYPDLQGLSASASAVEILDKVKKVRRAKLPDPDIVPNAGSFFKNPVVNQERLERLLKEYPQMPFFTLVDNRFKLAAGWLIEQAGLKSARRGGAAVHQRQALVLINENHANGSDVLSLARHVQQVVADRFAVQLEAEVRLLGARGLIRL